MDTATLLTYSETCARKGAWSKDWERRRLDATTMLRQGIIAGLTSDREDFGEAAGETIMELAENPGMEMPTSRFLHESVIHHAALADMLTTAIRQPKDKPWGVYPATQTPLGWWASSAFIRPTSPAGLLGVTLASSWNAERHYSTVRSWYGIGEVALQALPMTMVVVILGQHRDGRRSGPWTKGFLHPQNHKLRFRKKSKTSSEVFSDRWEQVWREDRGEISNRDWLQAMLEDDILRDVLFTIEILVPGKSEIGRIRDMAARKMERLEKTKSLPEASLSVCDRPPCPFRGCCHSEVPYSPSEKTGFIRVGTVSGTTKNPSDTQEG